MAQMTHKKFCEMIEQLCTLSELIAWEQVTQTSKPDWRSGSNLPPSPETAKRHLVDRAELKDKILRWSANTATLPGEIE
jgi:hypothetical protein